MSFANTIKLTGLTTREAIADAFYRVLSAFDENDPELLDSAMAPDITMTVMGDSMHGLDNIKAKSFTSIGPMDTTHFVTSVRIDVESDAARTAKMTANTLAQHYPTDTGLGPSERRLLGGSKHVLTLVKDERDGLWKLQTWTMKIVWTEGDRSVLSPPS